MRRCHHVSQTQAARCPCARSGRAACSGGEGMRVFRASELPERHHAFHGRLPGAGAGETPIIALAPAMAAAVFDAAGVRPRSLPFRW